MRFILASASPRRAELLRSILDDFEIMSSRITEKTESECPDRLALENALAKANDIAERYPDAIVFGFDTVVVHDCKILGKPADMAHAKEMLATLSGSNHDIVTGYAIIHRVRNTELTDTVFSSLTFKNLTGEQIDTYVENHRPLDRAGAYDIAEVPEEFVDTLTGSYSNIRGLPVEEFRETLRQYLDILLDEIKYQG